MATDDRTDDSDDRLLVPLSESLVRKLDTARGDQPYDEYLDQVLDRAQERTEADISERGTAVEESAAVDEPGDATTGQAFENYWHQQMRTVFAWLWVGVIAMYAVGDLISTYFVLRTDAGFEANPAVAGLLEVNPVLVILWKVVAILLLYYFAEALLRQANHTRIPWVALGVPGFLTIWGSFVTGMNFMNIPSDVQLIAGVSIVSAVATVIVGYLLLSIIYRDFVSAQEDYPGFALAPLTWLLSRPVVKQMRVDPTARKAAGDLAFPSLLFVSGLLITSLVAVLPSGSEFRGFLLRSTRYGDLFLVLTALVVIGAVLQAASYRSDAPDALNRVAAWTRGILTAVVVLIMFVSVAFVVALSSSQGTELVESINNAWSTVTSTLGDMLGPLAAPGSFYYDNSPIGVSISDMAVLMLITGLLASIPLCYIILKRTQNGHSLLRSS